MTVYFSVVPDITPDMLAWARQEYATRQREEAAIRSAGDLDAYKRRRGLRRRDCGYGRDMVRRLMQMVEAERAQAEASGFLRLGDLASDIVAQVAARRGGQV